MKVKREKKRKKFMKKERVSLKEIREEGKEQI